MVFRLSDYCKSYDQRANLYNADRHYDKSACSHFFRFNLKQVPELLDDMHDYTLEWIIFHFTFTTVKQGKL